MDRHAHVTGSGPPIRPVVISVPWTPNATLRYLAANVLGRATLGKRTYCVLYDRSGEAGEVAIQYKNAPKTSRPAFGSGMQGRRWHARPSRILPATTYVTEDSSVHVPPAGAKVTIYSSHGRKEIVEPARSIPITPPAFGDWRWREAAPGYDDSRWASSPQPEAFGICGFQNGYGWYRAKFTASAAGIMSFNIATRPQKVGHLLFCTFPI